MAYILINCPECNGVGCDECAYSGMTLIDKNKRDDDDR